MELQTDKGQMVKLLGPLTRPGGEGQVFEIEKSAAMVAKLYHKPADAQKATKLRYQVQLAKSDLRNIAAWPTDLLLDPRDRKTVRGVVMPRMAGKEIHKLYGPADRAAEFPSVTWDFLIHVGMNCAAAFETLHEQGVVMADVNEGNLLVKEGDGRVGLIDCDSYQIKNGTGHFLCDVGIPMWTPPELQGQNFSLVQRTPNHDRFGLAIIIFRLLFMGRHPFAGIPVGRDQFEIEEAIKKCLFAFSPQTWARGVKPPPFTIGLTAIPGRLANLFDRAFLQASVAPNARPTGREWVQELKGLLTTLKKGCIDPGHKYWNGMTSCPWCEIVTQGGPNFFISVAVHIGSASWAADCATFWAAIQRVAQGALMGEHVVVPAIAKATPRAMPLARPQTPTLSAPIPPTKASPPPKPLISAPVMPKMPVLAPPAEIKMVPMGTSESIARICFLGGCFFTLATLASFNLELGAAIVGAGWGAVTCTVIGFMKAGQAKLERRQRKELERTARAEERQLAEEEFAQRMADYDAEVGALTQKHAAAVAQGEAEYRRKWVEQDQAYQRAYNLYLTEQHAFDAAQTKYVAEVETWNAEVDVRSASEEQSRRAFNALVEQLEGSLDNYKGQVKSMLPALESAKQRFDKARNDELADMRQLHQRRQDVQLQQFLATQLIQDADIPNIGSGRKATLNAYGFGSALALHREMGVPGFGSTLVTSLMQWRRQCEARFRYNPNTPLPAGEVNAVKIKHGQMRQTALAELREGAAKLEILENKTRAVINRGKTDLLHLARAHAQAIADISACS